MAPSLVQGPVVVRLPRAYDVELARAIAETFVFGATGNFSRPSHARAECVSAYGESGGERRLVQLRGTDAHQ